MNVVPHQIISSANGGGMWGEVMQVFIDVKESSCSY